MIYCQIVLFGKAYFRGIDLKLFSKYMFKIITAVSH